MKLDKLVALFLILLLASCYKDDYDVEFLPAENNVLLEDRLFMGSEYSLQIFYDLESSNYYMSKLSSWDLGFSALDDAFITINTGMGWTAYITDEQDIDRVSIPQASPNEWRIDDPSLDLSSLALGDFTQILNLEKEVVILRRDMQNGSYTYYAIKISNIREGFTYDLVLRDMQTDEKSEFEVKIPDDFDKNFFYAKIDQSRLNFTDQSCEPSDMPWDFVFTRYSRFFPDDGINYIVTGVLLNSKNTYAYLDSVHSFENLDMNQMDESRLVSQRDVIGFDWKVIDEDFDIYRINEKYKYIIRTEDNNYFKLKFTDFYNQNNEKGAPSFEYKRL